MEARDLGNTITLYLPQAGGGAEPYAVFQDRQHVGKFTNRDESLRFARALAETIGRTQKVPVRVRSEDESGLWQSIEVSEASPG
jgi:hypothetical protein